jgi:hypothetical protein
MRTATVATTTADTCELLETTRCEQAAAAAGAAALWQVAVNGASVTSSCSSCFTAGSCERWLAHHHQQLRVLLLLLVLYVSPVAVIFFSLL